MKAFYKVLLGLTIATTGSLACDTFLGPEQINIALNYRDGVALNYDNNGEDTQSITGCKITPEKQYLRVTSGIVQYYLNASAFRVSDNNKMEFPTCKIKNNPLKSVQTNEEKEELYQEKSEFYRSCVTQVYSDESEEGLVVPEQKDCQYKRVSKNSVEVLSGICHFKINPDSEFFIKTKVNDKCTEKEFFKTTRPQEVSVSVSYATVATLADDEESEMDFFGSSKIHLSAAPYGVLPVSDPMGLNKPDWSASYTNPDINLGKLELKTRKENLYISLPFIVDNRCEQQCVDGVCTSACDYMKPVVGELVLSEVGKNGRKEYLKSAYVGNVAHANWQGVLPSINTFSMDNFKELLVEGNEYVIDVIFSDPKIDYMFLMKRFGSNIGSIQRDFREFNGQLVQQIDTIGAKEELPETPTLSNYSRRATIPNSITESVNYLEELLNLKSWPPFYNEVCTNDRSSCINPAKKDEFLQFEVRFKLGKWKKKGGSLLGSRAKAGVYTFKKLDIKKSDVFGNKSSEVRYYSRQPEVKCN